MPSKIQVLNIVIIALQYSLVFLLYTFLYRVVKVVHKDLTRLTRASPVPCQIEKAADSNRQAQLVVISDEQSLLSQNAFPVLESFMIGRSQYNDLVINDNFVSHEHACISNTKQIYLVADLNSTNGTLLNGQPIEGETLLADGDVIQIGAVTLKFER